MSSAYGYHKEVSDKNLTYKIAVSQCLTIYEINAKHRVYFKQDREYDNLEEHIYPITFCTSLKSGGIDVYNVDDEEDSNF